jgi:putative thioredoxin
MLGYQQNVSFPASPAPQEASDVIQDGTTASFRQDVIAESLKRPVLVDFWAPWCGPCKELTPVLEKVVKAAAGKVRLVKINIDENPQISGQLGIQSIPAIIAFQKGQPIDGFMGALPEGQIKGFIERLVGPLGPTALEADIAEAQALHQSGDSSGAVSLYAKTLLNHPSEVKAVAGLASLYIERGDLKAATELLATQPEEVKNHKILAPVQAAFDLAVQAALGDDTADLERRIALNEKDYQARFDLAIALNAKGRREEAADQLLEIIRHDRNWQEDGARKQLVQFFEIWGANDEATLSGRRRLSSLLFA